MKIKKVKHSKIFILLCSLLLMITCCFVSVNADTVENNQGVSDGYITINDYQFKNNSIYNPNMIKFNFVGGESGVISRSLVCAGNDIINYIDYNNMRDFYYADLGNSDISMQLTRRLYFEDFSVNQQNVSSVITNYWAPYYSIHSIVLSIQSVFYDNYLYDCLPNIYAFTSNGYDMPYELTGSLDYFYVDNGLKNEVVTVYNQNYSLQDWLGDLDFSDTIFIKDLTITIIFQEPVNEFHYDFILLNASRYCGYEQKISTFSSYIRNIDFNLGDSLLDSAESFLSFELLPDFSLIELLAVVVGIPLLIWILKLFLGG